MRYCYCNVRVSNPQTRTCGDCLIANDQIVGCGQGLLPCGGTTTINLNTLNHNPSDAVYSLKTNGYSTDDFSSVSISSAGVVTIVTGSNNYTPHGLHDIEYQVVRGEYKNFGLLRVCFDNPCDEGCAKCNTCEGTCYGPNKTASATVDCMATGQTYNAATDLNLASCDGTSTWTVAAPAEVSVSINNSGLISYDMTSDALPGITYRITWKVACSLYGMETTGSLDVTVEDKCANVLCEVGYTCNKCTGECEENQSDLRTSGGTVVGAGASFGVTVG